MLTSRTGGNGWGNNEIETYTARPDNAALDGNGHLAIRAIREPFTGTDAVARDWTSARLDSSGKWSFTTGTLSVRMKLPAGRGLWPAFWLLGTDIATAGWPQAGEIDVMECFGASDAVYQTVHGPNGQKNGYQHSVRIPAPAGTSVTDAYHVFSVSRSAGAIVFRIDGAVTASLSRPQLSVGQQWVFDRPMFLLLNLAVGGFAGEPSALTPSPSTLLVDWIRYQPMAR